MQIEEGTKRFWSAAFIFILFMLANFYLYVGGHPCTGPVDYCAVVHYPNGTTSPVPPGQVAYVTKDPKPVALFDMAMLASVWALALAHVMKRRKKREATLAA